jgi:group I intron endonuclease
MENNNFTVYMHINKINSKKYIGITKQKPEKRWSYGNHYKSSPHFYSSIKKYGWDNFEHLILFEKLSEIEAKNKEIELIAEYNTTNNKYGYNCTKGGDGISGYKCSEEQRKKMSERQKGYKASEETKEKMRIIMTGREFTDEWKNKISESHIGDKNPSAKPVVQLNGNYELIKEFSCGRYAEQELGINVVNISQVCLGKAKSAGGYIFMFKDNYEEQKENLIDKYVEIKPYKRRIIQLSLDNEYINTFNSAYEAGKILKIDDGSINNVCKGKKRYKTAGGYVFMYEDEYEEQKDNLKDVFIKTIPHKRAVVQLSLDNKIICNYNTIREASKLLNIDHSSITAVCKGKKQKTAGGFKWEYASQQSI